MGLTPRERQVARHLIQGYRYLNIAMILEIEEATVRSHTHKILIKSKTASAFDFGIHALQSEEMLKEIFS